MISRFFTSTSAVGAVTQLKTKVPIVLQTYKDHLVLDEKKIIMKSFYISLLITEPQFKQHLCPWCHLVKTDV